MSSDDQVALERYMERVRRHCVSLAYVRKDQPSPEDWKFATGILLEIRGKRIVATAGHWVDKVHKFKADSKLQEIHIRYSHVSNDLKTELIEAQAVSSDSMPRAEGFDAAFILLPREIADDIEKEGNHFLTREQIMQDGTEKCHLAIVCGYPVQGTIITKNPAFYTKSEGQFFQYDHIQLGSLAFQPTLLRLKYDDNDIIAAGFDCDANEFLFRPVLGKINCLPDSDVTSAAGMSGGPVFAVATNAGDEQTLFNPNLLGMQVAQKYIEKGNDIEITELRSVSARRLINWIDSIL